MTNQRKSYALPIAMMFALFFMIAFVTGLQNPMGVIVKNQWTWVTNLMSQLGNFANFIAYVFLGIPAGLMLQKIGYKKTALSAIVVGFVGVGITFLSGQLSLLGTLPNGLIFGIYLTGAFISGFSMCMLNTVVNPMLNTLGGGGNRGNQLIQFGGAFNSIGATIVPVLVGAMIGNLATAQIANATPALFLAMGIFALTFLVLYFVNIPEPQYVGDDAKEEGDKKSPLSFPHFVFGAICIFLYVGLEVGIPNIANLFMTSGLEGSFAPMDPAVAGTVVGTYWFLMMIGRLIGGAIGAKVSSKSMLTVVSSLAMVFILLAIVLPTTMVQMPVFKSDISVGMADVPVNVLFFVLCGLCTSVMWGGIFNLAVEGLGKYTAAASGIFMVMVCGGGILPLIQGSVADATSSYLTSYWVVFAALAFILWYALIGCKTGIKKIMSK